MRSALVGVVCAAVAVAAYFLGNRRINELAKDIQRANTRIEELSNGVASERRNAELVRADTVLRLAGADTPPVERAARQVAVPSPANAAVESGSAEAAKAREANLREEMIGESRERARRKEQDFSREPIDGSWAAAAAQEVESAIRSAGGPSGRLAPVECRTSTCRFEGTFDSVEEHNHFFDKVFSGTAPQLRFENVTVPTVETAADGRVHTVFFVVKRSSEKSKSN